MTLEPITQGSERHDNDVVDHGRHQKRFKGPIGERLHALGGTHHVHQADGGHQRGALEDRDHFVDQGGAIERIACGTTILRIMGT